MSDGMSDGYKMEARARKKEDACARVLDDGTIGRICESINKAEEEISKIEDELKVLGDRSLQIDPSLNPFTSYVEQAAALRKELLRLPRELSYIAKANKRRYNADGSRRYVYIEDENEATIRACFVAGREPFQEDVRIEYRMGKYLNWIRLATGMLFKSHDGWGVEWSGYDETCRPRYVRLMLGEKLAQICLEGDK